MLHLDTPINDFEPPASLIGSVTYLVSDEDLIAPLGIPWAAQEGRL